MNVVRCGTERFEELVSFVTRFNDADNAMARTLYNKFGFVSERVMRGYRKQV